MSTEAFYHKISQFDLKEIIEFLNHNQTEITIKVNYQYIKTKINYVKNDRYLSIAKFHTHDFSNEVVLCSFTIRDEVYFFDSYLNSTNSDCTVEVPNDIFQLQRRNDFRVSMPLGLTYECTINLIRGNKADIKTEIRDLSMGGCQLSVPSYLIEINSEDLFEIKIVLDRFEFNNLELRALHLKHLKDQDIMMIGASYTDMSGELFTEMRAMLMHIDRVTRGKLKE